MTFLFYKIHELEEKRRQVEEEREQMEKDARRRREQEISKLTVAQEREVINLRKCHVLSSFQTFVFRWH